MGTVETGSFQKSPPQELRDAVLRILVTVFKKVSL